MTPTEFRAALAQHDITVSDEQLAQFAQYFEMLVTNNRKFNLTAITAEGAVYEKHFFDSILPAFVTPELRTEPLHVCDVGAGAGFPSLPLKILFPQLHVTIVDSLNKRINFLNELVATLGLSDVKCYHARAEEVGKNPEFREQFDVVCARAVASLNVLAEFCLPLVKVGGHFLALKAAKTQVELQMAAFALNELGGTVVADEQLTLPASGEERHIVVIAKAKATPAKYPRKPGMPLKRPLVAKNK